MLTAAGKLIVRTSVEVLGRTPLLPSMMRSSRLRHRYEVTLPVIVSSATMVRRYTFGAGSDGRMIWSSPASALASSMAARSVQILFAE